MTDPFTSPLRKPVEETGHLASTNNDNRAFGDFASRYGPSVWAQIVFELALLVMYLGMAMYGVALSLWLRSHQPVSALERYLHAVAPWGWIFFAGVVGGSLFALKFLYHAVAKNEWNRDRILWRFIVPINSVVLAIFLAFGVASKIVPFLDDRTIANLYAGLFFGFFVGYFADHALARLQRLALDWFGTVDRPGRSGDVKTTNETSGPDDAPKNPPGPRA